MKIVLWACHEAGYRVLRMLFARGATLLVVTTDTPEPVPSVRRLAQTLGVQLLDRPDAAEMEQAIRSFAPDLGLCVYYPDILPATLLDVPRYGSFNLHPSLLPRHRGCFSAPWAILEGDDTTGVTCHRMTARVDAGGILCRREIAILPDETAYSLYYRLVDTAVAMAEDVVALATADAVRLEEPPPGGCFHLREIPHQGVIDPAWSGAEIDRFIRAMYFSPYRPAVLRVGGMEHEISSYGAYLAITGRKD